MTCYNNILLEKENNNLSSDVFYSIKDILKKLPHYYPFLLLDKVISIEKSKGEAIGIKNVTFNEPFFPGHFIGNPIMPGVLQIEALAQLAAFFYLTINHNQKGNFYFVSIDKVKFRKTVIPGDVLYLKVKLINELKRGTNLFNRYHGEITVEKKLVCQGEFMATIETKID